MTAVVCHSDSDFFFYGGMLCSSYVMLYVTGYAFMGYGSGACGGIRREMKCACGIWNVGVGVGGENGWVGDWGVCIWLRVWRMCPTRRREREAHTIGPAYRRALGARR